MLQTYADGTVVRWIQEPQPGEGPPERPAPTVDIQDVATVTAASGTPSTGRAHGTTTWIWVAVAVVLWAIAGAGFVYIRRRRP